MMCLGGKRNSGSGLQNERGEVSPAEEAEGVYKGAWVWGKLMWLGKNICKVPLVKARRELWRSRGHRGFFPSGLGEGREKEK